MVKHLSNPPKQIGISKTKVIVFVGVVGIIVFLIIVIGVLDDGASHDRIDEPIVVQNKPTIKQTEQILEKVRQSTPVLHESDEIPIVPIVKPKTSELSLDTPIQTKSSEEKYTSKRAKALVYIKDIHPNSSATNKYTLDEESRVSQVNNETHEQMLKHTTSPYVVQAGSVIPAIMINGINSDLSGVVTAMVRQNVYDSVKRRYLLIPQGAKLIGKYDSNVIYGQERLVVAWNRLIYPNGDSIILDAIPGSDIAGYSGFNDQVDNKYWKIFGSSFIMGVITASMQYSQNNTNPNVQVGGLGVVNTDPTFGQTLSGSLGQQMGQTGMMVTQKNLNVKPTLIIRPHYPFNIILTADLALQPY